MAAVYSNAAGTLLRTDEKELDTDNLESTLESYGLPRKNIDEAVKGGESINYVNNIIDRLKENGDLNKLNNYFSKIGYRRIGDPDVYDATSTKQGVVAYTDGNNLLGVNYQLEKRLEELVADSYMSEEIAEHYLIAHEYVHRAQPDSVKSNVLVAETDAEMRVAEYFLERAQEEKDPVKANEYQRGAEFAMNRFYSILEQAIRREDE